MFNKRVLGGLLALTLGLAACSNDTGGTEIGVAPADGQQAAAADQTAATPAPAAAGPSVAGSALRGDSPLGEILVGADGRALYGFTNDTQAASTCYGGCAEAWPPVIVGPDWTIGPELDLGIFATTVRDDGQLQLVAGKWPLYFYAGDAVPGDVNGQGSGDVWFVIEPNGTLITDASPAPAPTESSDDSSASQAANPTAGSLGTTGETTIGTVLVDDQGRTLYGFTNDADGLPTCNDACAEAWPPVIAETLPADLDPTIFSLAPRDDGTMQLVAGKWPLYRFAGDAAPGDINGQGSGGVWWAAAPDGSLINDSASESADVSVETDGSDVSVETDGSDVSVETDGGDVSVETGANSDSDANSDGDGY